VAAQDDAFQVFEDHVRGGRQLKGHFRGLKLCSNEVVDLVASREFHYLHRALSSDSRSEGEERAIQGCWYFAKSVRELDDGISMFLASAAIEAWILPKFQGRSLNAARAIAWFSCLEPGDLCGRDRNPCPYLLLDPGRKEDLDRLYKLKELGNERESLARVVKRNPERFIKSPADGWTCAQWSRGAKWYDLRSAVAHGRAAREDSDDTEAERHNKRFWIATRVLNPILNWLEEHPATPAEDLLKALSDLQRPGNWDVITDLIDRRDFSKPCPYVP
jgi:hypothetical protein